MEKRNKAMIAVACVALLVLIGAGCARCTMAHSAQQEEPAAEQADNTKDEEKTVDELAGLLGSKWTAEDGKATLSIVNGAFVERSGDKESILYWEPGESTADAEGFSQSILISQKIDSEQTASIVRIDHAGTGAEAITCDAFKLANPYIADAPEEDSLNVSGGTGYLANLTSVKEAGIVSCLQEFAKARSPYAKTANWDGEVYIDANANKTSSTYTLDDPNQTIVTVNIDGSTGKISAM